MRRKVVKDVTDGYISLSASAKRHGMVMAPETLEVNMEATEEKRAAVSPQRKEKKSAFTKI